MSTMLPGKWVLCKYKVICQYALDLYQHSRYDLVNQNGFITSCRISVLCRDLLQEIYLLRLVQKTMVTKYRFLQRIREFPEAKINP